MKAQREPVRVVFVADVHVSNPRAFGGHVMGGVNARGLHVLKALEAAVANANESDADALVILGDLFDSSRATPQLEAATMRLLAAAEMPVHVLLGNHDQESASPGDHALAPLALLDGVTVHEKPAVVALRADAELWVVPFRVGAAKDWLPGALQLLAAGRPGEGPTPPGARVALALHMGIVDADTPEFLQGSPGAVPLGALRALMSKHNVSFAAAGDWHSRRVWEGERKIVQVGALCPTGFQNPGLDGYGFAEHWTGEGSTGVLVAPGPRFVTVRSRAEWEALVARVKGEAPAAPSGAAALTWDDEQEPKEEPAASPLLGSVFVRWVAGGTAEEFKAAVGDARVEGELGCFAAAEVVPDAAPVKEAAQVAAAAARAAPSLQQQVIEYVRGMGLPPERWEEVAARTLHYVDLGAGSSKGGTGAARAMRLDSIELVGFTNHKATKVRLPRRGAVIVTGENGSGKSSLLEGVAWGGWGQTLRGTSPVNGDTPCEVKLGVGPLSIHRRRKGTKGKVILEWSREGESVPPYETATKAQEALDKELGDFDRWRRTRVFTSTDAWGFADAPDGQRKLLLEQLLGLGCFDTGLERCRLDLRTLRNEASTATIRAAESRVRNDEHVRAVAALERGAPPERATSGDDAEGKVERLRRSLKVAVEELDGLRAADTEHRVAEATARAALEQHGKACLRVEGHEECPTCGQPIPGSLVDKLQADYQDATKSFEIAHEARVAAQRDRAEQTREAVADVETLRGKLALAEQEVTTARIAREAASRHAKALGDARARAAELLATSEKHNAEQLAAAHKVVDLEIVERVLGLRGVRSAILDGALRAIENVSNVWLARVGLHGLALGLAMVGDKVAMEVTGAGGGQGYMGASAGERRRIALALMLALATIAQGSDGGDEDATLWFDEVFDVLDAAGVASVCAMLEEIAGERCVVIVSHNPVVLEQMPEAAHLHVERGAVQWVRAPMLVAENEER